MNWIVFILVQSGYISSDYNISTFYAIDVLLNRIKESQWRPSYRNYTDETVYTDCGSATLLPCLVIALGSKSKLQGTGGRITSA